MNKIVFKKKKKKKSICSYQLNIWYVFHWRTSILNWFLELGERLGACSILATGWPGIAVPPGLAHILTQFKIRLLSWDFTLYSISVVQIFLLYIFLQYCFVYHVYSSNVTCMNVLLNVFVYVYTYAWTWPCINFPRPNMLERHIRRAKPLLTHHDTIKLACGSAPYTLRNDAPKRCHSA